MSLRVLIAIGILLNSQLSFSEGLIKGTGDVGSVGRGQDIAKRVDFKDCLNVLNTKSNVLKNKVYTISEDGWSFVVRNDDNTTTVYGEDGAEFKFENGYDGNKRTEQYKLKCENVTNKKNAFSGAIRLTPLYDKAMSDKTTSFENRKIIKEKCEGVTFRGGMMSAGGPPAGYFIGIPTPPAKTHNR